MAILRHQKSAQHAFASRQTRTGAARPETTRGGAGKDVRATDAMQSARQDVAGRGAEAATAVVGTSRRDSGARIGDARVERKRAGDRARIALAMRAAGRRSAMHGRHGPAKNSDTMQTMPANQTSERNDAQFSRYISA